MSYVNHNYIQTNGQNPNADGFDPLTKVRRTAPNLYSQVEGNHTWTNPGIGRGWEARGWPQKIWPIEYYVVKANGEHKVVNEEIYKTLDKTIWFDTLSAAKEHDLENKKTELSGDIKKKKKEIDDLKESVSEK